ncbi:MAG: HAD-IA family hydrolase [Candidatus Portnoybacteria bacterium]|nr:HAD-IA family hydrolase [Candidatus Portnoybacteria bacterium]
MSKIFIFDLDGTIADGLSEYFLIFQEFTKKYKGVNYSAEDFETFKEIGIKAFIKRANLPLIKPPFLVIEARKKLSESYSRLKPIRGIADVLIRMKEKGYLLGIITSNSQKNLKTFLKNNQLDFFDFTKTGSSLFGKASKLKKIITENKLDKNNIYYVGDEIRDIEAAKKNRVKSIGVIWGLNSKQALKKPSLISS